jgi:hypothetical protein
MTDLLQHGVVTAVALAAAWVLVRRVFGVFAPASKGPGCASCAAGQAACGHGAAAVQVAPATAADAAPLTLHRRPRTH